MLLSFSISNYRSIRDKATISFLPVKGLKELPTNVVNLNEKTEVLSSAVIYGANASGKSNVLKALTDFIDFIVTSYANTLDSKIEEYDPFLLNENTINTPTKFEIEFLLNNIRYIYTVSCNKLNIVQENLVYYPKGQKVKVYERFEVNNFKYGTVLKGEKKSIENRLLSNQLYLSKAAVEELVFLKDIYKYFESIRNPYDNKFLLPESMLTSLIVGTFFMPKGDNNFKRIEKIITSFDIGIHSLKINKNPSSIYVPTEHGQEQLDDKIDVTDYELVAVHKTDSNKDEYIEFPLERESDGTKKLFTLAISLLEHFEKGSLMIVDEFERSLHPHIVHKLVQLFHDPELNINCAQLLFSTHAINLLDNTLFRRDQIWFTEKDENGATELFSLSQIEGVRKDVPYDKWYLSGRFGATPILYEPDLDFNK